MTNNSITTKKNTATLLALFFGFLGLQEFYLGKWGIGICMLIGGLICLPTVILPIIANIINTTVLVNMSDEEFARTYGV